MGIYEETYEKVAYRIKQSDERKTKSSTTTTTVIPEGVDDDDALVMIEGPFVNDVTQIRGVLTLPLSAPPPPLNTHTVVLLCSDHYVFLSHKDNADNPKIAQCMLSEEMLGLVRLAKEVPGREQ